MRVLAARERQLARQGKENARLSGGELETHGRASEPALALLGRAITRLDLSARAYHRMLRLARTIADLAGNETIEPAHVAEAVQLRRLPF
jgi:magnesium chelatase family protein